jgi:AmiR/NasT family two-component response regulator
VPVPVSVALNVYARNAEAFDGDSLELAATFASYAAVAVANMHLFESQKQLAEHLATAMQSRAVIDQAKGILMAERRCSPQEAFDLLVGASQRSNRKLRDVAQALVDTTGTPPTPT